MIQKEEMHKEGQAGAGSGAARPSENSKGWVKYIIIAAAVIAVAIAVAYVY